MYIVKIGTNHTLDDDQEEAEEDDSLPPIHTSTPIQTANTVQSTKNDSYVIVFVFCLRCIFRDFF